MPKKDLVLKINKPHFVVKLHPDLLEVDMKEGVRKKLEDAIEKYSALRGSIGFLFQTVVPLDVPLKDIDSVETDDEGNLKIKIPHRRDIKIPLTQKESEKLVGKMNELIRVEKEKELRRLAAARKLKRGMPRVEKEAFEASMRYG